MDKILINKSLFTKEQFISRYKPFYTKNYMIILFYVCLFTNKDFEKEKYLVKKYSDDIWNVYCDEYVEYIYKQKPIKITMNMVEKWLYKII